MRDIYGQVVNFDGNTITVLEELFSYEDGTRGARGIIFEAISREEYEKETSFDSIREYLKEEYELPEEFKDGGYNAWTEAILRNNEAGRVKYDMSYLRYWDEMLEELDLSEEQAYIFNCIGRGRCFDKDFHGNVNPELSAKIREYEA